MATEAWCKGCDAVVPVMLFSDRDAWTCAGEHITTGVDAVEHENGKAAS
jgi:hypothetical protein